jgi:hypothetical protein
MHYKDRLVVDDHALALTGRSMASEYDGLESGELAWIFSKQFFLGDAPTGDEEYVASQDPRVAVLTYAPTLHTALMTSNAAINLRADGSLADRPPMGYGADRHQRLAYTKWVEAKMRQQTGARTFSLLSARLLDDNEFNGFLDSDLAYYGALVGKASIFAVPDIAYAFENITGATNRVPQLQGINLMERGPFLRSFGVDTSLVSVTIENKTFDVERHIGSSLAQAALTATLKKLGFFNWTPDGITLSKLETGPDPLTDAEIDAHMGQLFNVGIQGPCITKTWCGDPEMQVMPMDKVFMLLVGVVSYTLDNGSVPTEAATLTDEIRKDPKTKQATTTLDDATKAAATAARATDTVNADALRSAQKAIEDAKSAATFNAANLTNAVNTLSTTMGRGDGGKTRRDAVADVAFANRQKALRSGATGVKTCYLSNVRWMRATSSYLSNRSHFDPKDPKSRCGLQIAYDGTNAGVGEYILGGWCIGTVLDSAASRSAAHTGVRMAPASMAINVNVNVEWWNPDKLYHHYQDCEQSAGAVERGTVLQRDANPVSSGGTRIEPSKDGADRDPTALNDDRAWEAPANERSGRIGPALAAAGTAVTNAETAQTTAQTNYNDADAASKAAAQPALNVATANLAKAQQALRKAKAKAAATR